MNSKKIDYDWVCHACSAENSKQIQQCQVCGCEAFASVKTMQKHTNQQPKVEFQFSREIVVEALSWIVGGVLALLFKYALLVWM
ncbi:hypothetical protein [Undibacterium pigrum]|uniref:hypothetical protein n=1 Tax=Undibacterium pigrum TaxID=401470 RepID=UPI000D75809F|nr:hypothetical protein [Undibacterium pigrum]